MATNPPDARILPDETDETDDPGFDFDGFFGEENLPPGDAAAVHPPPAPAPAAASADDLFGPVPSGGTLPGTVLLAPPSARPPAAPAPAVAGRFKPKGSAGKTKDPEEPPPPATKRLDVARALTVAPAPRDFALPCLRSGTVGGLVSPGGAGKSMLAMQLALMLASGVDAVRGLGTRPGWDRVKPGPAIYASFEDGEDAAAARLHSIWTSLGPAADAAALSAASANLAVDTLTGVRPPDLLDRDWAEWLDGACEGRRLLVLDTLRTSHLADENDAGAMSRLLAAMQGAALRSKCAILFLHHTSKAATLSGQGASQQSARGSSVITDNARGQFYLTGVSEQDAAGASGRLYDRSAPGPLANVPLDAEEAAGRPMRLRYARFGVSKSNYSAPWPEIWLRRDDRGVLSCADVGPAQGAGPGQQGSSRKQGNGPRQA